MIRYGLVTLGLLLLGWQFGGATLRAETIRADGATVLFDTAPVDPRDLLLGDYMRLRYDLRAPAETMGSDAPFQPRLRDDMFPGLESDASGLAVFRVDENGVARIVRFGNAERLEPGERLIRYRRSNSRWGAPTIGGERYYFQSGTGERFADARYGVFKVMPDGRALLSGLADADRRVIAVAGETPATE